MENNKIYAQVKWYDFKKGYGIAISQDNKLFLHSSYFVDDVDKISENDMISCTPIQKNGIYHALNAEVLPKDKIKTIVHEFNNN